MSYNPYGQAPNAEAGYGYGQQEHELEPYGQPYNSQPYSQQPHGTPQQSHQYGSPQQQSYNSPAQPQQAYSSPAQPQQPYGSPAAVQSANVLSTADFLSRVSGIREDMRELSKRVDDIVQLHQRALTSSDGSAREQLDALVAHTQIKNTAIRDQIQTLKGDAERTSDGSFGLKKRQFESLNKEYKDEIQKYLREEQEYRERYREQIARQYRIVNPSATEAEVQQAQDADWDNEGVFQTALKSNRSGHASEILRNVQARHTELLNIERQIRDLMDLMQYLSTQVVEQSAMVQQAAQKAEETTDHLDNANVQLGKGVDHARRRRRLKWWCALVVFLIVLAIALGVGLGIALTNQNRNKTDSGGSTGGGTTGTTTTTGATKEGASEGGILDKLTGALSG